MRVLLVFFVGLLVGLSVAAALLYFNPLTDVEAPSADDAQWLLYDSPLGSNLFLTHRGELPLRSNPDAVPELWESTIDGTVVLLVELRRSDGSLFGLGTRISALSEDTELLRNGVQLDSYWTVSAPGKGSLFVAQQENVWPVLKEVVLPTVYFTQGWRGTKGYALNAGPLPTGHGLVLGATGEFRDQRGRALERYELRRYSGTEGPVDMSAELGILLPPPAKTEAKQQSAP